MPNKPRVFSESGYMHVYTRGNNKQIIFEDRGDYICYLQLLRRFSTEIKVTVCAFCLMENHTHMIIYDIDRHMPQLMKKLNMSYTAYFNLKHKRSGHLFGGKYKSIPIETEGYLLNAFRYVINNPRDANICSPEEYPWSSFSRYGAAGSFVDTSMFQKLIGNWNDYIKFLNEEYEDRPELENIIRDDEWAKSVIRKFLHIDSGLRLQTYELTARNSALRLLKKKGLTVKQIERLTGINRNAIERA